MECAEFFGVSDVGGECRTSGIVWRRCQGGVSDVGDSVVLSDVVGLGGGRGETLPVRAPKNTYGEVPGPGPGENYSWTDLEVRGRRSPAGEQL